MTKGPQGRKRRADAISRGVRIACVAFTGILPSAAWAQGTSSAHASADDCAVIAEVGKTQLHWNFAGPPNTPVSRTSYGLDCDWKALGLADPVLSPADSGPYFEGVRLFLSPPRYSTDGLHATMEYGIGGNAGPSSYFSASYTCTIDKRDGQWHLLACQMRYIT